MEPKIVVLMTQTKPTPRMVRFDIEGGGRETMPNAYVSQEALKAAFGHFPDKVRITVEEVK